MAQQLSQRHKRRIVTKEVKNILDSCNSSSVAQNLNVGLDNLKKSSFKQSEIINCVHDHGLQDSELLLYGQDSQNDLEDNLQDNSEKQDNITLYNDIDLPPQFSDSDISNSSDLNKTEATPMLNTINLSAADFLREWSLRNNLTHNSVTELLVWFRTNPELSHLPVCARTLLKTPRNIKIQYLQKGTYFYFGLQEGIKKVFEKYGPDCGTYYLDFNIDGLPIHKSSKTEFWPILCMVSNFGFEPPFIVALYSGKGKPPLTEFLEQFVVEYIELKNNGIVLNNNIQLSIICRSFCCDMPARSFIKGVKGHNAYYGCDRCCQKGVYVNHRMTFPDLNARPRTTEEFILGDYKEYHKCITPLLQLNIDIINNFIIDYMHCVCLGVTRKLLFLWRDGGRMFGLTREKLSLLNTKLTSLKKYWPTEFNRKPREISELEHWKATELRQFLLYIAPLLKDLLPKHIFANLMLLKFGITILMTPDLNSQFNNYANKLLRMFVIHSIKIYGADFCSYNVHVLLKSMVLIFAAIMCML